MVNFPRFLIPLSVIGTGVGSIVLFRDKMGGGKYENDVRIPGRTVIVTGANTGIGKEVARELAVRGARVIMACRDMDKCEETRKEICEESYNNNVCCKQLDLKSLKSVREFARDINQNENRLDVLINNAGVMGCPREITEDGFETQLGVNHMAPFLLTKLLTNKLVENAPSRILYTSSVAISRGYINFSDLNGKRHYDAKQAYLQSKLATTMSSVVLAEKTKGTGVSVYTIHPGIVKTELGRHMGMNNSWISSPVLGPLWWSLFKNPKQGAQTTIYCALEPTIANDTGKLYQECQEVDFPVNVLNKKEAERLWLITEKWTEDRSS